MRLECGLDVDFVSMDDDFSGYRLLAAPLNYMYKKGYSMKRSERSWKRAELM